MFKKFLSVGLAVVLLAAQPWGVAKAAENTAVEAVEATEEIAAIETVEAVVVEEADVADATEEVAVEVPAEEGALAQDELTLITADTYYVDSDGYYPFTVEIPWESNQFLEGECTLSVLDINVCLINQQEATYDDGVNRFWKFDALIEEAGERTLTLVVFENGTEVWREDRTVNFDDYRCYQSMGYSSITTKDSWLDLNAITVYGKTGTVVAMELIDRNGGSVATIDGMDSYSYEDWWDNRYDILFYGYPLLSDVVQVNAYSDLDKYLKEGVYDAKITFEDGSVEVAKNVLCVSDKPTVTYAGVSGRYDNANDADALYIDVNGSNLDFSKIKATIYDGSTALTEVVEYKTLSDGDYGVYKLRKVGDFPADKQLMIKIEPVGSYEVVVSEVDGYEYYPDTTAMFYYAEHIFGTNKVKIRISNVADGTVVPLELQEEWSDDFPILATAQAEINNGEAVVTFLDASGAEFVFAEDMSYYHIIATIAADDYENVCGCGVSNRNYFDKDYVGYEPDVPDTIEGMSEPVIYYDGGDVVFFIDESVMEEATEVKATLRSETGSVIADELEVYKNFLPQYIEYDTQILSAWMIVVVFGADDIEEGQNYELELYSESQSYGVCEIQCYDGSRSYSNYMNASRDETNQTVVIDSSGYWSNVPDDSKWTIRLKDAAGNLIGEKAAAVAWGYQHTGESPYAEVTFTADYSDMWEELSRYVRVFFEVRYDGNEVNDLIPSEGNWGRELYMDSSVYVYGAEEESGGYCNLRQIKGVGSENTDIDKVYVYYPYDTTPVATIDVPDGTEGRYYFTAKDIQKLTYNKKNVIYDFVAVGTDGTEYYLGEAYLALEAVLSDVNGKENNAWPYEYVEYVIDNGIMSGTGFDEKGNTNFSPDGTLTREQFAQVLYNAEGKPAVTYSDRFPDVEPGEWYTDAVLWAGENNIVEGYNNGKFGTGDEITREQLAVMLYKYANMKGYDVTGRADVTRFEDWEKISDWAFEHIRWANYSSIINGKGKNLDPKGYATRAECATMITNFMRKFED